MRHNKLSELRLSWCFNWVFYHCARWNRRKKTNELTLSRSVTKVRFDIFSVKKGCSPVVFSLLIYPFFIFARNVEIRASKVRLKVTQAQWRARFQNQTARDIIFKLCGCVKSFSLNDEDNCSWKTICLTGLAWRLLSNYIIILIRYLA